MGRRLERGIDAIERRIERRLMRGNARLLALEKSLAKLRGQLKKVRRAG